MLLPGKAGGAVAVRRTLASTICRIADPTQVPRPRQLRDASTVMRFQPAHQSMINRRFDDRAPCLAWMSPKQALAGKPRIHSPASGIGGHESGSSVKNPSTGLGGIGDGARSKFVRSDLSRSTEHVMRPDLFGEKTVSTDRQLFDDLGRAETGRGRCVVEYDVPAGHHERTGRVIGIADA